MKRFSPHTKVMLRYGKSTRTIDNWVNQPDLGFPKPVIINNRKHYDDDELDAFDRRMAAASRSTQAEAA